MERLLKSCRLLCGALGVAMCFLVAAYGQQPEAQPSRGNRRVLPPPRIEISKADVDHLNDALERFSMRKQALLGKIDSSDQGKELAAALPDALIFEKAVR